MGSGFKISRCLLNFPRFETSVAALDGNFKQWEIAIPI